MMKLVLENIHSENIDDAVVESERCPECGFPMASAGGADFVGRYKCYKCVKIFNLVKNKKS